jgi:RimJ/RimL family protein N-acetyltransferase
VTPVVEVLRTERLHLRHLHAADAAFMLELLNEKPFLQNIGDRNVRTIGQAAAYIADGPAASYKKFGFGLYAVERKGAPEPIGICGVLQRDTLDDPDLGFAFLERFWRQGYAYESAAAVMTYARATLGLKRVVAITSPENHDSAKLLHKLGFKFEKTIHLPKHEAATKLFSSEV